MLFGLLVAVVLLGGGLLFWSSFQPPPGDPDLVDPSRVYPVTLPAGYAPPIQLDEKGNFSTISYRGRTQPSVREIQPDGTLPERGAVKICVVPPGADDSGCLYGRSRPAIQVETRYKDTRVLITPVDGRVTNLDEWRNVAYTSDFNEMTWLTSQTRK